MSSGPPLRIPPRSFTSWNRLSRNSQVWPKSSDWSCIIANSELFKTPENEEIKCYFNFINMYNQKGNSGSDKFSFPFSGVLKCTELAVMHDQLENFSKTLQFLGKQFQDVNWPRGIIKGEYGRPPLRMPPRSFTSWNCLSRNCQVWLKSSDWSCIIANSELFKTPVNEERTHFNFINM